MSVFLPFRQGVIGLPQPESFWCAFGLTEKPEKEWVKSIEIIQPWRADFLNFQEAGFKCLPEMSDEKKIFSGGLLELNKHKKFNRNRFLTLLRVVKAGGTIVVSGDKSSGASSFMKWVNVIVPAEQKLSKAHGIVFWLTVPEELDEKLLETLIERPQSFDDGFTTQAGMFSNGRIDQGSQMLVKYMDRVVFGKTADFGAGWGYLSYEAIKEAKKLDELDLYEADYNSLAAAKKHLGKLSTRITIDYLWKDITREPIERIYDTILSNPPFHDGRATDVTLGQKFIETAARRLKPGGCFLMVANRQLPYEATLQKCFRKVLVLEEQNGFKVIEARK